MEGTVLFWVAEVCLLKTGVYERTCGHAEKQRPGLRRNPQQTSNNTTPLPVVEVGSFTPASTGERVCIKQRLQLSAGWWFTSPLHTGKQRMEQSAAATLLHGFIPPGMQRWNQGLNSVNIILQTRGMLSCHRGAPAQSTWNTYQAEEHAAILYVLTGGKLFACHSWRAPREERLLPSRFPIYADSVIKMCIRLPPPKTWLCAAGLTKLPMRKPLKSPAVLTGSPGSRCSSDPKAKGACWAAALHFCVHRQSLTSECIEKGGRRGEKSSWKGEGETTGKFSLPCLQRYPLYSCRIKATSLKCP